MLRLLFAVALLTPPSQLVAAEGSVLYCSETHIIAMQLHDNEWRPSYQDAKDGKRYAIRFDEAFSEMTGFQGTDTRYRCQNFFPTKASDVVTCINPLVATISFSYSTKTGKFLVSMTGPGGWLRLGTEREEKIPLSDHIIFGTCQEF